MNNHKKSTQKWHSHGLNLALEKQHQSEQDWIYGGLSPACIAEIPEAQRQQYLPQGEIQNMGDEKYDCASRGPLNILESKFTYGYQKKIFKPDNLKWLENNGYVNNNKITFSDCFVAQNSNTTPQGNSLIAPLDAIRKQGLIPKAMLPQLPNFDDYYNPQRITVAMAKLGYEFARRFSVNYERVLQVHYDTLLDEDFLDVAGYAWPQPINNEYPKSDESFNHCFILFKKPRSYAFDNYPQSSDGSFIKKLAADYILLDYGYRVFIGGENVAQKNWVCSLFTNIKKLLW